MTTLESILALVPTFPGYRTALERRRSDELIRSYIGEALASARERLAVVGNAPLDDLILRCGFVNQGVFRAIEYAPDDPDCCGALLVADALALTLAEEAGKTDQAGLDALITQIAAALDRRDAGMLAAKPTAG